MLRQTSSTGVVASAEGRQRRVLVVHRPSMASRGGSVSTPHLNVTLLDTTFDLLSGNLGVC